MKASSSAPDIAFGDEPVSLSRRRFLLTSGSVAGAFVLGIGLPVGQARAQAAEQTLPPGTRVPAFLE
ncbi:MAG TPA: hypothetical protein DHT39_18610, partial [Pantoea sp.]|nr:hypothetical protein [Pantoea sp.]